MQVNLFSRNASLVTFAVVSLVGCSQEDDSTTSRAQSARLDVAVFQGRAANLTPYDVGLQVTWICTNNDGPFDGVSTQECGTGFAGINLTGDTFLFPALKNFAPGIPLLNSARRHRVSVRPEALLAQQAFEANEFSYHDALGPRDLERSLRRDLENVTLVEMKATDVQLKLPQDVAQHEFLARHWFEQRVELEIPGRSEPIILVNRIGGAARPGNTKLSARLLLIPGLFDKQTRFSGTVITHRPGIGGGIGRIYAQQRFEHQFSSASYPEAARIAVIPDEVARLR